MRGIPEKTLNLALRYLVSVPFDRVPKALPDDDGETLSAVLVYSELKRQGLANFEEDEDDILWSITPSGIRHLQGVDGVPALS